MQGMPNNVTGKWGYLMLCEVLGYYSRMVCGASTKYGLTLTKSILLSQTIFMQARENNSHRNKDLHLKIPNQCLLSLLVVNSLNSKSGDSKSLDDSEIPLEQKMVHRSTLHIRDARLVANIS